MNLQWQEDLDYKSLQKLVFTRLQGIYEGDNLVTELGALLNLQRAAVYKRISGETMIRFDELVAIAMHFKFSLESVFNYNKEQVSFKFDQLNKPISSYREILQYVKEVFDSFRNHDGNILIYSSRHLPFMHYIRYPALFEIHIQFWYRTSLASQNSHQSESHFSRLTTEDREIMKYLYAEYQAHPLTEVWGTNILEELYSKIKFLVLSNVINSEEHLDDLLSNIKLLINHLKQMTQRDHTEKPISNTTSKVYVNELDLGTPMLYYESKESTKCFLVHQEPNFVYTYQKAFCDYSKTLLLNIIDYSKSITVDGAENRLKYFTKVETTFEQFKDDIRKVYDFAQL